MSFSFHTSDISLGDITMFLAILVGVVIVLWIFVFILRKNQDSKNKAKPIERAKVRLIDKPSLPSNAIPSLSYITLLFEKENGQRISLPVNAAKTTTYVVGDEGELVWRGTEMLSFTPQKR